MPGNRHMIHQNYPIADLRVMPDMRAGHDKDVVADARHTMKLELRRNLLDRFVQFRKKDEDDTVEVILKEKMQQRLAAYLASLKSRSK